jgi:hypothetical protein
MGQVVEAGAECGVTFHLLAIDDAFAKDTVMDWLERHDRSASVTSPRMPPASKTSPAAGPQSAAAGTHRSSSAGTLTARQTRSTGWGSTRSKRSAGRPSIVLQGSIAHWFSSRCRSRASRREDQSIR